jgi:hypothetical protein
LHHVVSAAAFLRAHPDALPAAVAADAAALGAQAAANIRTLFRLPEQPRFTSVVGTDEPPQ